MNQSKVSIISDSLEWNRFIGNEKILAANKMLQLYLTQVYKHYIEDKVGEKVVLEESYWARQENGSIYLFAMNDGISEDYLYILAIQSSDAARILPANETGQCQDELLRLQALIEEQLSGNNNHL